VQVTIPCFGSIIIGDWTCSTPIPGLKNTAPDRQPPMVFTFWGFRVMYYLATVMFAVTAMGIVLRLRGRLAVEFTLMQIATARARQPR
jgi:cytochrome d ubiquinol oxidase subunit I